MQTILFTYRRKVTINGEDKFNDNYINPLNVTSFFWETNEEGHNILSVFLNAIRTDPRSGYANSYSIRFSEQIGRKFVEHMEDFLRYLVAAPMTHVNNNSVGTNNPRTRNRRPLEAEVVEVDTTDAQPQWSGN